MRIMLDKSPDHIRRYSEKYQHEFWQLRTPLTRNKISEVRYGLDNGCFSGVLSNAWFLQLEEAQENRPVFVCLPDIVGDARRTMDLFKYFWHKTAGLPRALVLQDGIGSYAIPWDDIECVFIGGTDIFKISQEAINCARCAKMLGKWVHVGRVNTPERLAQWLDLADSIDGSGISRYDHMLEAVLDLLKEGPRNAQLF